MTTLKKGALVYYKSKAAIVEVVSDKIDILFFKTTKRVRDKDIKLLHPGPLSDVAILDMDVPETLNTLDETLELLEGEPVPLSDLAELLYGEFTPQSTWSSWMLVVDGLYFEHDDKTDLISVRPSDLIQAEQQKRQTDKNKKEAWSNLLARIKDNKIEKEDYTHLVEIEQLACGEREGSRILKALSLQETKEVAHGLLIKLGYWNDEYNPWPRRFGLTLHDPEFDIPEPLETERRDLQHLAAWAIDDVGNQDPDDAISLEDDFLWVHIADVSSLVTADSELDIEARERGTNVYLPDQTIHMLPTTITQKLGLGLEDKSNALSVGFRITESGELEDIEICFSTLKVTRTTYDDADKELDSTFADLKVITDRFHQRRLDNNAAMLDLPEVNIKVSDGDIMIQPYSRGGSRQIVTEAMLAAGEAVALFAIKNNIMIPYAYQPGPEEIQHPEKLSEHYAYRRFFKASRHSTAAAAHFGLGLPCYTRVTSPIRRYLDLVVHQQLRAFLTEQPLLDHEAMLERIGLADEGSFAARKAERQSNQHWKLLYFKQHQKQSGESWQGEAVVVMQDERKTTLILPDLAIEPKINKQDALALDQSVTVQSTVVNVVDLYAGFKIA